MKKLYPLLSVLFLILGCSTDINTLQKRGETYYKVNSDKPFSGLIINKYDSGQKKSKGFLTNGKEDGIWTYWYKDHPINYFRLYMDGIMDNLPYIFYDSWENFGQKSKEVDFLNGKKDGLSTEWYENGQKDEEGIFKDDEKNGLWTSWYKNGQKMVEVKFKDGVEIEGTLWDYWENGQKRMEEYYMDGELISEKVWNEDGSLKE
tara:strand:+ start:56 stop:667 length:612 start_codon:yes stop_codon:yes gene_type:complete